MKISLSKTNMWKIQTIMIVLSLVTLSTASVNKADDAKAREIMQKVESRDEGDKW